MRAELLQLVAHILFNILEGVKESGRDGRGSRAVLDPVAQIVFGGVQQAAIRVVDDHELLGVQQIMGDNQGAQSIFGNNAASVSNDVGVAGFQTQGANRKSRIHASQDGKMSLGARTESAQFVRARVEFVGFEDFVDYAHGLDSLAKRSWI